MVKLEKTEGSLKKIVRENTAELAVPDWDLLSDAIKAGRTEEALDYFGFTRNQSEANNDGFVSFFEKALTQLAGFGEEEVIKLFRERFYSGMTDTMAAPMGVEEALQICTAAQRRHHASFTITEEPDRYVVKYDPCGSGGRLRRSRSVGITKKAYPWTWGMAGVPYYCTHCCVKWELIPIELRGYPIKITLFSERPEDPCVHLFYKKPELVPEEYFSRLGMKKDLARIKG